MGNPEMTKPAFDRTYSVSLSYRIPMPVRAVRCFHTFAGPSSYPVCPRCRNTMAREYQAFCDRCGQALDWTDFSKAVVLRSRIL